MQLTRRESLGGILGILVSTGASFPILESKPRSTKIFDMEPKIRLLSESSDSVLFNYKTALFVDNQWIEGPQIVEVLRGTGFLRLDCDQIRVNRVVVYNGFRLMDRWDNVVIEKWLGPVTVMNGDILFVNYSLKC